MFKSIEHKLTLYIALLIISVAVTTYLAINEQYVYLMLSILIVILSINGLRKSYNRFNKNVIFLLNAIDNGDYSFNFSETKITRREKELNKVLNKIKEILAKAREGVIENEKFMSIIIESMPVGVIVMDHNKNIKSVNKATLQLLNLHILTHINQLSTINKDFPSIFKNLSVDKNPQIKVANEREEIEISLHLSKIKLKDKYLEIITLNNIGNELEAKEMESWIQLIRVMTHEIMNSIAPITSLTETLLYTQQDTTYNQDTIDALNTINSTAKGLTSFVNTYRKFTGVPKPQSKQFTLKPILDNVILLSKSHIKNNVEIELELHNPDIQIYADKDQIMQVLINLIKNGMEATLESGKLVIKVQEFENRVSAIEVCNNGEPIGIDIAANIFIPFFTTKEKGTGIGLSLSRYIMRLHGGNLKYYTKNGWTIFSMVFEQ